MIYVKFEEYANALQIALFLGNMQVSVQTEAQKSIISIELQFFVNGTFCGFTAMTLLILI